MLELSNLANIVNKIKEVTGVSAFFNDKAESIDTCKFDLRYKGIQWLNPNRKGVVRFDLILCANGIGEMFVLNMINNEIKISPAFQIVDTAERMIHTINAKESIELLWNDDLAQIEEEVTESGKRYYYKRFFSMYYFFTNH